MIFDLVKDFADVLDAIPADHPRHRILKLLNEAIRRDVHFIDRHPTTFFQCMWNTCWWYDCPEAAGHYYSLTHDPDRNLPWERSDFRLARLIEDWKSTQDHPCRPWLRSLRPPASPIGTGQFAILRGHEAAVLSVAISSDGRRAASSSDDGTLRIWDTRTSFELLKISISNETYFRVSISPNGQQVAASVGQTVQIWDVVSGTPVAMLTGHSSEVNDLKFFETGLSLVSVSRDGVIKIWDIRSCTETLSLTHTRKIERLALSADGSRIAAIDESDHVTVWDAIDGRIVNDIPSKTVLVSVALSADGQEVFGGCGTGPIKVWDVESGWERLSLTGHQEFVFSVASIVDRHWVVSGGFDGTVRVWDTKTGREQHCFLGHETMVNEVQATAEGRTIISASHDRTIRVWDTDTVSERMLLRKVESGTHALLSTDGKHVLSGGLTAVCIWDGDTGLVVHRWKRRHSRQDKPLLDCVTFSSDDTQVIAGSGHGTVYVWNSESGEETLALTGHQGSVTSVAVSSNGQRIASAAVDRTIRIWDAETGNLIRSLEVVLDEVDDLAISNDGRLVAAITFFSEGAQIWDLQTDTELHVPLIAAEAILEFPGLQEVGDGYREFTSRRIRFLSDRNDQSSGHLRCWFHQHLNETVIVTPNAVTPIVYYPEQFVSHHRTNVMKWATVANNRPYLAIVEIVDEAGAISNPSIDP